MPISNHHNVHSICLLLFGCSGSSLWCAGSWLRCMDFLRLWLAGCSCCGARALGHVCSEVVACGLSSCGTHMHFKNHAVLCHLKMNHLVLPIKIKINPNCSVPFHSVAQSCPTLCNPMNRSTPGLPVHYQLLESTQIHVH